MLPRGLEPRTLRLLAVRSDQLSYKSCSTLVSNRWPQIHFIGSARDPKHDTPIDLFRLMKVNEHQWSSGRIHRCHRCDPGSIPG